MNQENNKTHEWLVEKSKELVKMLDGLSYHDALYVVGQLDTQVRLNSKVSISPTY